MKNLVLICLAFVFGLECFATEKGDPFAPYKEKGYSTQEAVDIISTDSILAMEFRNLFQQIAEKDGWIKSIQGGVISLENTIYLIKNLNVENQSWNSGEIIVRSRKGNKFFNLDRPSWSDRKNKVPGMEPVGVLDVTKTLGLWNGENSYPLRIAMIMRCINSAYDMRYQILPVAPLVSITEDRRIDTLFYAVHDTVWIENNHYYYNDYNNEASCFYTCPVYQPSYCYGCGFGFSIGFGIGFWSYPTYTYAGYSNYNYYNYTYNDYSYYNYQYFQPQPDPGAPGGAPGIGPSGGDPGSAGGIGPRNSNNSGNSGGGGGIGPNGPARGSYNAYGGGKSSNVKSSVRSSYVNQNNIKNNPNRNSSNSYPQFQRSSNNSYSQPSRNSNVAQNNKKSNYYSQPQRSNYKSYSSPNRNFSRQSYSNPGRNSSMVSGRNSFSGSRPSSGGGNYFSGGGARGHR